MKNLYANIGVERNKKPLQNILYWIEESNNKYILYWAYEKDYNKGFSRKYHGFVTEEEIKSKLTQKQWCKFKLGVRFFIHQRRENNKNIKIK